MESLGFDLVVVGPTVLVWRHVVCAICIAPHGAIWHRAWCDGAPTRHNDMARHIYGTLIETGHHTIMVPGAHVS